MPGLRSLRSSTVDSESQYEVDPDYSSDYDSEAGEDLSGSRSTQQTSLYSYPGGDGSSEAYISHATKAMKELQALHDSGASTWKSVLKHKSGVVVYATKEKRSGPDGNGKKSPVFKGEKEINGFAPPAVFGVVGSRNLWDDWYNEGNLVENLDETTSLTYMVMKGITGSTTRDLSLVERVTGTPNGAIYFVASSVVTPKVPEVSGRVRATLVLNGWVLEPTGSSGTKVTYYVQANVKTIMPSFATTRYMARRPVCIAKVAAYLEQHGAPSMAGLEPEPTPRRAGSTRSGRSRSSRRSKTASVATGAAAAAVGAGAVAHVVANKDHKSYSDVSKASEELGRHSELGDREWVRSADHEDTPIFLKSRKGEQDGKLPVTKGSSVVRGVDADQVLGTILNTAARKKWDPRFEGASLLESHNGFEQGTYVENHVGIFPNLGARHYVVTRAIERDDETITLLSKSTSGEAGEGVSTEKGTLDFAGWTLEDTGKGDVHLSKITSLDVAQSGLRNLSSRVLTTELATHPKRVAQFIDRYGFVPYFVRWGPGEAVLEGDDGNIDDGRIVYFVRGGGKGESGDEGQKAWLQWSEKMYERGVDIKVTPAEAAKDLAKVEGVERTLQIEWDEKVLSKLKAGESVRIELTPSEDGNGGDDVYVDGQYLDKTIKPAGGAVATGAATKKSTKKAKRQETEEVAASPEQEEEQGTSKSAEKSTSNGGLLAAAAGAGAAVAGGAAVATRSAARSVLPAKVPETSQQQQKEGEGENGQKVATAVKTSGIPDDAMLILTKDLYFTKSQCAFMLVLILGAYAYGKLS